MMAPNFRVRKLQPAEYRLAWPLVSLAHPGLTLARWLAFARRVSSGRRGAGMIAIEDQRGVIHALAAHRVIDDVERGSILLIEPVICARLPGRDLDDVLAEGVKDLAETLGCQGVVVETEVRGNVPRDTARALIDRGFVPHAVASFAPVTTAKQLRR